VVLTLEIVALIGTVAFSAALILRALARLQDQTAELAVLLGQLSQQTELISASLAAIQATEKTDHEVVRLLPPDADA